MPISESNRKPHCSLICVGSELLRGKINTHASTLARRLASVGLELSAEHTIGDDQTALTRLIRGALDESRLVIVTGGLGPTFDDLTREAAADAVGRRLVSSAALLRDIQRKFKKARYRRMPPANQRQADLIEGASSIANKVGTAPGQWLEISPSFPAASGGESMDPLPATAGDDGKRVLILLPGPPSELHPMLEEAVLPKLSQTFPQRPRVEAHLHFVGVPESVVDHKIRPIIAREKAVDFTILAHLGLVDFDIFVSDQTRMKAGRRLSAIVKQVRKKMGAAFYGMGDDYPLENVVRKKFMAHRSTLAVAESCTGGMLAKLLTDIPGSSDYFLGGVVSYSNRVKQSMLGVSEAILARHRAVSQETAAAMAEGVRARTGSRWGLSITGIAGPGGGSITKPVGLVFIGLAGPRSARVIEYRFRGSRDAIRQRAVIAALDLLRQIYL